MKYLAIITIAFFPLLLSAQLNAEFRIGTGYGFDANQFREETVNDEIDFTTIYGNYNLNLTNPLVFKAGLALLYKNIGLGLDYSYQHRILAPTDLKIRLHSPQLAFFYRFNIGETFFIEPGAFLSLDIGTNTFKDKNKGSIVGSLSDIDTDLYFITPANNAIVVVKEDYANSSYGFSLSTNCKLSKRLYLGLEGSVQFREKCPTSAATGCNSQNFHTQAYDAVTNEVSFPAKQYVVDLHRTFFLNVKLGYLFLEAKDE